MQTLKSAEISPPLARRLRAVPFALMLMAGAAYAYSIPHGNLANADSHIALTRAIVDDHVLYIDHYAAALSDRARFGGHYYTDKAPGVSILSVPAYFLLRLLLPPVFFQPQLFYIVRYLVTLLVVSLPTSIFLATVWRFLSSIVHPRKAVLISLGFTFGTMTWSLSALLFSHMIAAMCLFGAFMLLYPLSMKNASPRIWRWLAAGALCGWAVVCEYPALLVTVPLDIYAFAVAWQVKRRLAPWLAAGLALAALGAVSPLLLYNTAVYGSPLAQGYAHLQGDPHFIQGMGHGLQGVSWPSLQALWGITFSPYRGLFSLSPFLLLAVPGLLSMWRDAHQRAPALLCAAVISIMLLFNSSYYFWDGGASLGPRHLDIALPFFLLPLAFAFRSPFWSRVGIGLIAVSILIVASACLTVLIFIPGLMNPFSDLVLPALAHGAVPNNWAMFVGLRGIASTLPLIITEAVLSFVVWLLLRPMTLTLPSGSPYTTSDQAHPPARIV